MQAAAWLNIWKPAGVGSRALANILQVLLSKPGAAAQAGRGGQGLPKAGHVGTLDNAAAGVVPLALGGATRLIPFLPTAKSYEGSIKLGVATSSDDLSGVPLSVRPLQPDEAAAAVAAAPAVLQSFVGDIMQQAPAMSAVWINGRRSYKVALEAAREAGSEATGASVPPLATPRRQVLVRSLRMGHWCAAHGERSAVVPASLRKCAAGGAAATLPSSSQGGALVRGTGRALVRDSATPIFDEVEAAALPSQLRLREAVSRAASAMHREGRSPATAAAAVPAAAQEEAKEAAAAPAPQTPPSPSFPSLPVCGFPELSIAVDCGPGVYIRSIARDLGAALEVPSTLASLTRTAASGFSTDTAVHMLDLRAAWLPELSLPPDFPFRHLPAVAVGRIHREDVLHLCVRRIPRGFVPPLQGGKQAEGEGGVKEENVAAPAAAAAEGAVEGGEGGEGDKKTGPPPALDWSLDTWAMPPVTPLPRPDGRIVVHVLDEGDASELLHVWRQTTQALLPGVVVQGPPVASQLQPLLDDYVCSEGDKDSYPPRLASGLDAGYVRVYAALAAPSGGETVIPQLLEAVGNPGCMEGLSLQQLGADEEADTPPSLPSRLPRRAALQAAIASTAASSSSSRDSTASCAWVFLGLARVVPRSVLYPQAAAALSSSAADARPHLYLQRVVSVV